MLNKKSLVLLVLATVVITALFFSGCVQGGETVVSDEKPQLIQTYGEAEVSAEPDMAKISLEIETRSTSAEDAVEDNAALANAVREALLDLGLEEEDITTGSYRLMTIREDRPRDLPEPDLMEPENELVESISYQANNEIVTKITDIDAVGEIIDTAVAAGANRVNYISFDLEDAQDLKMQALAAATEQAARKAEAIAGGTGESITGLYSIREERTDYRPYRIAEDIAQEEMAAMSRTPTQIAPDKVIVRASVVAEYRF